MTLIELLELADSEKVFAGLFIITLFVIGRWVKNFIHEQVKENNEREKYIMDSHEKQLAKLEADKTRTEDRYERLINDQQMKFKERNSLVVAEYRAVVAEQRADNERREKELMAYLDRTGKQMSEVSETLHQVQVSLEKMEQKIDKGFDEVWHELRKEKE